MANEPVVTITWQQGHIPGRYDNCRIRPSEYDGYIASATDVTAPDDLNVTIPVPLRPIPSGQQNYNKNLFYSSKWTSSPLKLGSNQVDFGGIIPPVSAIEKTVLTSIGCIAIAAAYSPLSTFVIRSRTGRAPPRY